MRCVCVVLLLAAASGAAPPPFTGDKLALLPGLWPWERRALAEKVVPLLRQGKDIRPQLLEAGVHPGVVEHLSAVPPGPLLKERYAHSVVLLARDLSPRQRALFEHMVPAVDAAQLALAVHGKKLRDGVADETLKKQVQASHESQIHAIEARFWRVVMYALNEEQQVSIKKLYPETYNNPPNVLGHVYQLPKLTPSQTARIRALVQEFSSESAADSAEVRRLARELSDGKLSAEERARLQQARSEAGDRNARRLKRVVEASAPIYTPGQKRCIEALVPMVSPQDRGIHPGDLLKGVPLSPAQQKAAQALGKKLQAAAQANQGALRKRMGAMAEGEFGSDAPQTMAMQSMQANAHAANLMAMEEVGGEIVLDVLQPRQVTNWVVAP